MRVVKRKSFLLICLLFLLTFLLGCSFKKQNQNSTCTSAITETGPGSSLAAA